MFKALLLDKNEDGKVEAKITQLDDSALWPCVGRLRWISQKLPSYTRH